jgi:hypothetical protein
MSPERFAEVFGRAFVIRRVERGPHGERVFGWAATFSSAYFTSDTDRIVGRDHGHDEDYPLGWGDSIEAALDALAKHELDTALARARSLAETQHEAEVRVAELRAKLSGQ